MERNAAIKCHGKAAQIALGMHLANDSQVAGTEDVLDAIEAIRIADYHHNLSRPQPHVLHAGRLTEVRRRATHQVLVFKHV